MILQNRLQLQLQAWNSFWNGCNHDWVYLEHMALGTCLVILGYWEASFRDLWVQQMWRYHVELWSIQPLRTCSCLLEGAIGLMGQCLQFYLWALIHFGFCSPSQLVSRHLLSVLAAVAIPSGICYHFPLFLAEFLLITIVNFLLVGLGFFCILANGGAFYLLASTGQAWRHRSCSGAVNKSPLSCTDCVWFQVFGSTTYFKSM